VFPFFNGFILLFDLPTNFCRLQTLHCLSF